jgi:hypothetical protein
VADGTAIVIARVATGATTAAAAARARAEDGLIQTATGAGRQQSCKQTEKNEAFHDFLPLLSQSRADFRQTLSSEQSGESRKSSEF